MAIQGLIEKFEIRVDDKAGVAKAYYSSTAMRAEVLAMSFSTKRIGGCNALSITTSYEGLPGTVEPGYLVEVWVKPQGGSLTRYWWGEFTNVPDSGGTSRMKRYEAKGLGSQLKQKIILKYYAGAAMNTLISSLITSEFSVDTDVSNSTTEVSLGSPYTVGDAEFEFVDGLNALESLAAVQKSVNYGVDQDGKVYFKDRDISTVLDRFWVGKDIEQYEPQKRLDDVMNSLIIQSKQVVGGGFLTMQKKDATSITAYGERTKIKQVPYFKDATDAWRLAEGLVAADKDPKTEADVTLGEFVDFQFPHGIVKLTDVDGNESSLEVQAVVYSMDESTPLRGRFEVGDAPPVAYLDEMQRVLREMDVGQKSNISAVQIEHTAGEEWKQDVLVDARKQGNMNVFVDTFKDVKALDQTLTFNMDVDSKRNAALADIDAGASRYVTNIIPGGRLPATIRLHYYTDLYGRVNFVDKQDLSDFFQSNSDWRIRDGYSQAEHFQTDASFLKYLFGTQFVLPDTYTVRFGVTPVSAKTVYWYFYAGWLDATHWIRIRMQNTTSNFIFWVQYNNGGGVQTLAPNYLGTKDLAHEVEYIVRNSPANSTMTIFQGGSQVFTNTYSVPDINCTEMGPDEFYDGGSGENQLGYLDYLELQEMGAAAFSLTRNDGGTWVNDPASPTTAHGQVNKDITMSGAGDPEFRIRCNLSAPARLYGWGISWKADA
jgi:hypothetical protein